MSGLIDLFVPREKKFFELLNQQMRLVNTSIGVLPDFSHTPTIDEKTLKRSLTVIQKCGEDVDRIETEIISALHQTFITPIDREEIQALTLCLSRTVDSIEKIVAGMVFFKMKRIDTFFQKQWQIFTRVILLLTKLLHSPLNGKENKRFIKKIKELEKEADTIYRQAIAHLFTNNHTPIAVLKQRELYALVEEAIDDIKHTADLLQMVLIIHA